MSERQPEAPQTETTAPDGRPTRPYEPPALQEYGSLKELTHTLSNLTPGDGLGASYAT